MASTQKRLRLANDLTIRVSRGVVEVSTALGSATLDDIVFRILDVFTAEHTVAEAMSRLWQPSAGRAEWVRVSGTIIHLERLGALVAPGTHTRVELGSQFGGASVHIRMLDDHARTTAFISALNRVVTEDDVVLDLGTGTGILALAAARAGARAVYAIERSAIGGAAQKLFQANGFGSKITLLQGWSTALSLPERATVLVTETIGTEVFDEQITSIVADARARLLTPGALLIPRGIRVYAVPVTLPSRLVHARRFTSEATERWREMYGFDFSPLVHTALGDESRFTLSPSARESLESLADAAQVLRIDLATSPSGEFDRTVATIVSHAGEVNAVLISFDVELAEGVELSTAPTRATAANSWGNPVLLLESPVLVAPGDQLAIRLWRTHGRLQSTCSVVGQSTSSPV